MLSNYNAFKHALVHLVCASASRKTQDAFVLANGDVASFSDAMTMDIDALDASISRQTTDARASLSAAYLLSLAVGASAAAACILLVFGDLRLIMRQVVTPVKNILSTIKDSSGRINHMAGEVLKRTRSSKQNAASLSTLSGQLSATFQEVAGSIAAINENTENVRQDVQQIAEECSAITSYTAQMNQRADAMQQSARNSAEITSAKAEEILSSLNDAIEKSKSVDQIQEINSVVTAAVYNLSGHAQNLIDYMGQSVLTEFRNFVQSGSQYKEDAAYIRRAMDEFYQQTEHLKNSISEIADAIGTITESVDNGANGIASAASSSKNLAQDMEDITLRMGVNQEVVDGLEKETAVFDNL